MVSHGKHLVRSRLGGHVHVAAANASRTPDRTDPHLFGDATDVDASTADDAVFNDAHFSAVLSSATGSGHTAGTGTNNEVIVSFSLSFNH